MISSWATAALLTALAQAPARSTPPPAPPVVQTVPVPTTAPANPFSNLFKNLGTDTKAMVSPSTAVILGVGGVAALVVHASNDQKLYDWVQKRDPKSQTSDVANFVGGEIVQGGGSIIVWGVGRAMQKTGTETLGADLIRAHALNGVLTQAIKVTVQRTRPSGSNSSFPSGHTSSSITTAAVIQQHYGFAWALPFYGLGGAVAFARIRTNHHWLSDTVFGAALGIASGRASTRYHATNWNVAPVKTPGGVAVYVTRTSTRRTASPARR